MVQFANETQKRVYDFIKQYILEKEYSPMLKDIAGETGYSLNHCGRVVNELIADGHLIRKRAKQGLEVPELTEVLKDISIQRKKDRNAEMKKRFSLHHVPKS